MTPNPLKFPLVQGGTILLNVHASPFLKRESFQCNWYCEVRVEVASFLRTLFGNNLNVGLNPVGRPSTEVADGTASAG